MVMETPVNAPQQDAVAKLPNHEPRLTLAQAFNAASNARDTLVMRRSLDGDEHLGPAILASPSPPCTV